jgi:hypothetical protein
VAFKLYVDLDGRRSGVVCRVPNLLTEKTAPAMLHFLHHLIQACFQYIEIVPGATAEPAECVLNPLVLQALPKFRLRGVKFGRAAYRPSFWGDSAELSNRTVKMAFEMRIRYNLLYYHLFLDEDLPPLIDFIANGRQLDKMLEVEGYFPSQQVDQIIKVGALVGPSPLSVFLVQASPLLQHFEEDVHSLEEAIRDVRCKYIWEDVNWPARCPREAATQVTERDDGTVDYRFDYINVHSKEPFSLLLEIHRHEGRTPIHKFHFKFGSA